MKYLIFPVFFLTVFFASQLFAQGAVQLPEFQHFDASTTVMVPDAGSVNTGGITRSSSGSTSSGTPLLPFRNRSYGSSNSTSSVQTSVQVIDLQEMDEAILNSPTAPVRTHRPGQALVPEDRFQQRQNSSFVSKMDARSTHDKLQSKIQKKNGKSTSKEKKAKRAEKLREPLDLSQQN